MILESYEIERRLADMGYRIERYSGAGIKVFVEEIDGSVRGLDVFGGFYAHDHLMVMGEIRVPLPETAVFPLGTTTLEGRTLPAPADTDAFLVATYGPHWRTPDPAFVYETPRTTYLRFNDWFRGTRVNRKDWDRATSASGAPTLAASRRRWRVAAPARGCRRAGRRRRVRARRRDPLAGPARRGRAGRRLRPDGLRVHDRLGRRAPALALRFAMLNLLETPPRARLGRPARARARRPC